MRSPGVTPSLLIALGAFVAVASSQPAAPPAVAQETTTTTAAGGDGGEEAEQLALGSAVFARACTGCHQTGGVGIVGQFPPLKDNPNVTGAADYVQQTVREGRQGEIVVNGVTYDAIMPAVGAGLSDEEVAAVAAYVAANLTLPEGAQAPAPAAPVLPGSPDSSLVLIAIGFGLTAIAAAIVLAPLVLARTDRLHLSWVEGSLKALVVVAYFVIAVVLVPAQVMELDRIGELSEDVQYLIGSAVWGGGVVIGLVGLWWAHRKGML